MWKMSQFVLVKPLQKQCQRLINVYYKQTFNVSTWTPLATAFNSRPGPKLNLSFTRDDAVGTINTYYITLTYMLMLFYY